MGGCDAHSTAACQCEEGEFCVSRVVSDLEPHTTVARKSVACWEQPYIVTQHCIQRYMERSGCQKSERAEKRIQRLLVDAVPVRPKKEYRIVLLLRHRLREVTYLRRHDWFFVIDGSLVVTCYQGGMERWEFVE